MHPSVLVVGATLVHAPSSLGLTKALPGQGPSWYLYLSRPLTQWVPAQWLGLYAAYIFTVFEDTLFRVQVSNLNCSATNDDSLTGFCSSIKCKLFMSLNLFDLAMYIFF